MGGRGSSGGPHGGTSVGSAAGGSGGARYFARVGDLTIVNVFPALTDGDFHNRRLTFQPNTENV